MLDKFYLIIDDVSWLDRLLPLGLKLVQLRIKNQPDNIVFEQILQAKKQCEQYHCQLVINDYWQFAIEAGCHYIHLGQEDLISADLAKIKQANIKFGVSTHTEDELAIALACQPDYIALGPIFETTLKKMPYAPQGLARIQQWKNKIGSLPLVAIGGIKLELAENIYQAGADSIAVVTDVLFHQNPEKRLKQWLNIEKKGSF